MYLQNFSATQLVPGKLHTWQQADIETCCHCDIDYEPKDGEIVANGCALLTCSDVDGFGTNFTCGANMYLQNFSATQLVPGKLHTWQQADIETCCHCDIDY